LQTTSGEDALINVLPPGLSDGQSRPPPSDSSRWRQSKVCRPSQRQTGAKPHCLKASHTGSGFSSAIFQQYRPNSDICQTEISQRSSAVLSFVWVTRGMIPRSAATSSHCSAAGWPLAARAQQAEMRRIEASQEPGFNAPAFVSLQTFSTFNVIHRRAA
jgi:hypothetical protein